MKFIAIQNSNKWLIVDAADAAKWTNHTFHLTADGYVSVREVGSIAAPKIVHRVLMGGSAGRMHPIDHIDGDKLNNTRANLRFTTARMNLVNRHRLSKNNSSGIRGVSPRKNGTWLAQITRANGKKWNLGYFGTKEEARLARMYGEMAVYGQLCPTHLKAAA